jgi:hypothetical protein
MMMGTIDMELIVEPIVTRSKIKVPPSKVTVMLYRMKGIKQPPPDREFPGRAEISNATIKFDGPIEIGVKIERLDFRDISLVGVIPLRKIEDSIYECAVDWIKI